MDNGKKILIVGPSWIGDMVMAQVLFKLIKQQKPDANIHVLASEWTLPLLDFMPEVAKALILPFAHGELNLRGRYQFAKKLRVEHYDQAIILPNSFKSALIPYWAKIPIRTGWSGEMRWGLINDIRKLDKNKLPLMIERFAALGSSLDIGHINVKCQDLTPSLHVKCQDLTPTIALCPGAEYGPAKRWPPEYFAEVAKQKLAEGWQVWLFGSKKDEIIANEIQEITGNKCKNFVGKTSLSEVIKLLAKTSAVVTNDSGLMHIAAALQKPLIVIYGSSSAQFTPPLAKQVEIATLNLNCSPCFKRQCPKKHYNCLTQLKPAEILAKLANFNL